MLLTLKVIYFYSFHQKISFLRHSDAHQLLASNELQVLQTLFSL